MAEVKHKARTYSRRWQLARVNDKISQAKPESNVYGIFALTARLARQAAATAVALSKDPQVEAREVESVLNFWVRLSDYAGAAALNCLGGNQTLTEALVTRQFLLTARARKEEPNGR
ncbi:MAG: hypothetical protein ABSD76_06450 [Terriglobales bacterium]